MKNEKIEFEITPENEAGVRQYAAEHGMSFQDALDKLVNEAFGELFDEVIEGLQRRRRK